MSSLDLKAMGTRAHGGFVLEMGDDAQYGSFEAFARHIAANRLVAEWHESRKLLEVAYRTGTDLMEAGFTTDFGQRVEAHFPIDPGAQQHAIPWRRLNGQWPYLPAGLDRDSGWAQQGTTGRLEKNGAVLTTEPGRRAAPPSATIPCPTRRRGPSGHATAWCFTPTARSVCCASRSGHGRAKSTSPMR